MRLIMTYRAVLRQMSTEKDVASCFMFRRMPVPNLADCALGAGWAAAAYRGAMTDLRFADDREASRYTLHDGDDLVSVLDYRDDGRTIALTRSFTIPTFRGRGYAAVVVEHAVDAIEQAGDREILPVCWYVGEWFEAHPERAHLLHARG
jgi:predicted GNAT family acetyltransferase